MQKNTIRKTNLKIILEKNFQNSEKCFANPNS